MKKSLILFVGTLAVSTLFFINIPKNSTGNSAKHLAISPTEKPVQGEGKSLEPNSHWLDMRSYPDGFNQEEYITQIKKIRVEAEANRYSREVDLTTDWLQEGPGNIGGRINVLAVSPTNNDIIYAGAANGGVFKTMDGGDSWNPIFDDQAYLSVGAITIDPNNESVLYVGTGDRNFGGGSYIGNGIYKSTDNGASWTSTGLEETAIITEIIIDPTDSDRVFASALGNPFEKTDDRGVYRSEDGGITWINSLFIADSAGVIDLIMDPSNPDVLYAAGFNRTRSYSGSSVTGPDGKIFKTINGGDSWTELSVGLPTGIQSRIGLAISNDDPNTVYALYVGADNLDVSDIYKSTNAGASWAAMGVHTGSDALPDYVMGGFGWYFGEVYLNPYNNNQLIVPGVEMYQSIDGGTDWEVNVPAWWTYDVHADKHAIAFLDATSYIIATDGGLYKTINNGENWTDIDNIPITQFYHIEVDPINEGVYFGGAQDNGSISGNSSSFNDWERVHGGDGFRIKMLVDDPNSGYMESQYGNLVYYTSSFPSNIAPTIEGDDRVNWDMPFYVNENFLELFVGTAYIQLKYPAPYGAYTTISPDLTRVGLGEDFGSRNRSHTISELDQPNNNEDILYVGTTDGLVWRGERDGADWDWTNITGDLPNRYVTGVKCSPNEDGTVYVSFSGYKNNELISYLYRSQDFGATWVDISSNLPDVAVNDVLIVPSIYLVDTKLFVALDGGVYFSENSGDSWDYVGVGIPTVTVSEIKLDIPNEKLIAGTYSRSMWSYDVSWLFEDGPIVDVGINEIESRKKLNVYPNPVVDVVYFDAVKENEIQVYDVQGNLVLTNKISHFNGYSKVNLSTLKTGTYYFNVGNTVGSIIKL